MKLFRFGAGDRSGKKILDASILVSIIAAMLILSGCGGSSAPDAALDSTAAAEEGIVYIGLTDAEGDFVNYSVDVLSLKLQRANGDMIETLPLSTRVDFTELTEVTEFLSIATIPAGFYTGASITLDFATADVIVQNEAGDAVAADVVGSDGAPLGVYELRLQLTERDRFRIAPGIPAAFSLDFDLDASNTVDFSQATPSVTVEPFLLATPELETDREHRVRGALANVNEAESQLTLKVRPFRHRNGDFGRFTLNVDEQTQYEVDGTGYTGAEGLAAMALLSENAPVVANGAIRERSMHAEIVVAGSSVPWADGDVVKGVVAARNGNELTVAGARIEFRDGVEIYRGLYTVLVGDMTTVSAPGIDNNNLTINSISVGQRIVAFGELRDDETFDASASRVVMRFSHASAQVVQASPLALDLYLLNTRRPARYDFAGTGVSSEFDADPDFYEIDTGNLTLANIEVGDLVRIRGLVNEFGAAPADFNARTVIDVDIDRHAGELLVVWPADAPSQTPFINTSATRIDVDISASREVLKVRGIPREFTNPLDALSLLAPASGQGAYAVAVRGSDMVSLYRNFEDLVTALNAELAAGSALHRINARVGYTGDTDGLITARASFIFSPAQTD